MPKTFGMSFYGYNKNEVNDFLNNVTKDAKKNASRIINDALIRAQKIQDDADKIKLDTIKYRNKAINILKEQKEILDKYEDIEY